jgi:lysophospholipase L1-like esterase
MIIGDSIAVGVSHFRKECTTIAKSGINSTNWNKQHYDKIQPSKSVIISLGSNDYKGINTFENLLKTRKKISDAKVFWILPNEHIKHIARKDVEKVAEMFGDVTLERPLKMMSPDGIHPTFAGYKDIANRAK